MSNPENLLQLQSDIRQIRATRIRQFIYVAIVLLAGLSIINIFTRQSAIMITMLAALATLFGALYLLRYNRIEAASNIVLLVTFFCICQSMWAGSGLRSAGVIGYPGVLLLALIMVGQRSFWAVYAGMLAFMLIMTWATENGWREGLEHSRGYLTMIDFMAVLSAATFVVRVLAIDLLTLLQRLRVELSDVESSKREAEHRANHDDLTGLPNRTVAESLFQDMLRQSIQDGSGLALVFVDVDYFKQVNDRLGHQCGDDLLRQLTSLMSGSLRKSDRLIRIAGDEFVILLAGVAAEQDVAAILAKINRAVQVTLTLGNEQLIPSLSMGVALAPANGTDFQELLKKADQAMYQAKSAGRNQFVFHRSASA